MKSTEANTHPGTPPRLIPDTRPAAERIRARGNPQFLKPSDADPLSAAERRAFDALAAGTDVDGLTLAAAIGGMDPMRSVRALRGRTAIIDGQYVRLAITARRMHGRIAMYRMTWETARTNARTNKTP